MDARYVHTQRAPLCLFVYGAALLFFVGAFCTRELEIYPFAFMGVGGLMALLALAFHHLTVRDEGDRLAIRFGPLPLFATSLRYADIESVEVGRTLLLDGWGIHLSVRGGWVWNLWGRACVVVRKKNGGILRIGTDEPANLERFLKERISGAPTPS